MQGGPEDDTVRLRKPEAARMAAGAPGGHGPARAPSPRARAPAPVPSPSRRAALALSGAALAAAASLLAWAWLPGREGAPAPPVASGPAPGAAPPAASLIPEPPLLTEAEIAALLPAQPAMLRLRENPRVFVLLFPTLEEQGAALNRLAALVEKAGLPRDRLLGDAELSRAIEESGDRPATWYLGHDYPGAELARFFALAERDGIVLNEGERWVRDRFREARALVPAGEEVALISTANPDHRMDAAMRATILRHEVGHGHFFTRPEVAAHVMRAWRERFREADREAFRTFLAREGYDTTNEALMANEAMAYLLFTPDPRFFAPRHIGLAEAELTRLRAALQEGMPLP